MEEVILTVYPMAAKPPAMASSQDILISIRIVAIQALMTISDHLGLTQRLLIHSLDLIGHKEI